MLGIEERRERSRRYGVSWALVWGVGFILALYGDTEYGPTASAVGYSIMLLALPGLIFEYAT